MITNNKIKLRNKKLADARNDYRWRTDTELARLDAASILTTTFPQYLSAYACELCYPSPTRCEFAIETLDGKHIGNCLFYCSAPDFYMPAGIINQGNQSLCYLGCVAGA